MSELSDAKKKFKELYGRKPHHTWGVEKIEAGIKAKIEEADNDEEKVEDEKPEKEVKQAKALKPIHSSLFVPKADGNPARTVLRENFNERDLKQYKEAYADRLKKAMKKLA